MFVFLRAWPRSQVPAIQRGRIQAGVCVPSGHLPQGDKTLTIFKQYNNIRPRSQVVRQGSAKPLSAVQFRPWPPLELV